MKKTAGNLLGIVFVIVLVACNQTSKLDKMERWREEIMQTEADFAAMAAKDGIGKAFIYYAADSAVLMRSNKLIAGKEAIITAYGQLNTDKMKLTWKPDFVEVASSGDLAYTYGQYIYSVTDSMGKVKSDTGIFHTVWKRQTDGNWRFVWD